MASSFRVHSSALVFIIALILYSLTLSPGLLPADAGEYQVVGAVLGVAHPPGFALYTLASWLISRTPLVAPATAINFLSALLAAGALALLCRAVQRLTGSALAGVGAAAALGLSSTFWAQATTANIRMPAAFATAWAFERLVAYRAAVQAKASPSSLSLSLALFALAAGVGISHHASVAFVMAVLGVYALGLRPAALRRPWQLWPLLLGLVPLLAWLYFPLRAGAFGAPPRIATLDGFIEHVTARGFAGDLFFFANAAALPDRLRIFANILTFEFVWPVLLLMAVGLAAAIVRLRGLGWTLLAATAVHVFVSITYRAPQTVEYLLPGYVLMAAWVGLGLAELAAGLRLLIAGRGPAWLPGAAGTLVAALVVVVQGLATGPSYAWLAHDDSTRAYAEAVLTGAPPGAVILSSWNWATPMWYLQQVERLRPDVEVRYVFPSGTSLAQNWVGQINSAVGQRPVVVTSFFQAEYRALPLHFIPLGPAWLVQSAPLAQAPTGLAGAQTFGAWSFLGYRIESAGPQNVIVTAAWQPAANAGDVGLYVHLLDAAGQLDSQMDVQHAAGSYAPGEVLLDRYVLPLRPDAPAASYQLTSGVYRADDGTPLATAALTSVSVPAQPFAGLSVPAGALPLGNDIWLIGHQVSTTSAHPGDTISVDLSFLAARPISDDDTVSVALVGPGYQWQTRSDGTPAGGAIPTLKWIAGSKIDDRHRLTIPANAAPGTASLSLTIYDAFTQRVLPVLDPDLAAQGQSVPLGSIEVQ